MTFTPSELIINPSGSIYHLDLLPEDIAQTIILVGDPDRVAQVSKHFDHISLSKQKREFCTHTGTMNDQKLTVISTGIGTDNIDIVLNELDALANINFSTRTLHPEHKSLNFIRIGTTGGLQPDSQIDSFLISKWAVGMDGLGQYYEHPEFDLAHLFHQQITSEENLSKPYAAQVGQNLIAKFPNFSNGITITAAGFYGPQGRNIRLTNRINKLFERIIDFEYEGLKCTNLEMETAGIYLLANLLGHEAISFNAILANRSTGEFSTRPKETVERLIEEVLGQLVE